jgi:hypothetical protein
VEQLILGCFTTSSALLSSTVQIGCSSTSALYRLDIIKRVAMADCKPCTTPIDLQMKLAADSRPPIQDAFQFQSIAGALQYLTFTWPDITYVVQHIYLHMHDPREPHLTTNERIPRYL